MAAQYEVGAWDLSDLNASKIDDLIGEIDRCALSIESKRERLTPKIEIPYFLGVLKEFELLRALSARLGCFTGLRLAEDSANAVFQADHAKVFTALTKINNRLLFLSLWFKELPEDAASRLIEGSGKYRYFLEELRKTKPYTLK